MAWVAVDMFGCERVYEQPNLEGLLIVCGFQHDVVMQID